MSTRKVEIIVQELNAGWDHLSRNKIGEEPGSIEDGLPDAQLFKIGMVDNHYEQIVQFLTTNKEPEEFTTSQKNQLVVKDADFQLIASHLYKMGPDEILRRYVLSHEHERILAEAHAGLARGHYGGRTTVRKILQAGLWWLTMHNYLADYAKSCDICQSMGKPSQWDEMLLIP